MKKAAQQGTLSSDSIYEIMSEEKANQAERISFKVHDLRGFFPKELHAEADDRYHPETALRLQQKIGTKPQKT